jgi:hypothetical protein
VLFGVVRLLENGGSMRALVSHVCNSRILASLVALAALSVSCASSRRADPRQSDEENERPGSSSSRDAGKNGSTEADHDATPDAGSGTEQACRGPGRYTSGKAGGYLPCCDGLNEVFYRLPGESGENNARTCDAPPLRVYACVEGECGDGICETGEAPACGCVEDCPQAAWEGTEDAAAPSGEAGAPVGCAKSDILAELELEPGTDCGDVPVTAPSENTQLALECARNALAASKPFHLFWSVVGTDSVNHLGVIALRDGDSLKTFIAALVPANTFGSGYKGANARWTECDNARVICEDSVDRCLKCQPTDREACVCAPANEIRPITPNASGYAIDCVSLDP